MQGTPGPPKTVEGTDDLTGVTLHVEVTMVRQQYKNERVAKDFPRTFLVMSNSFSVPQTSPSRGDRKPSTGRCTIIRKWFSSGRREYLLSKPPVIT